MKTFYLLRSSTDDDGTFGRLFDNIFACKTAEPPYYGGNPLIHNEKRVDCIPVGEYECAITNSPTFGKVYMVHGVLNRSAILLHAGNFAGNTAMGKKSDTEGCILLGQGYGILDGQNAIISSRVALNSFHNYTKMEPFRLIVQQPEDW